MENSQSSSSSKAGLPAITASDRFVSDTMKKGFESMIINTTVGLVVGGLAGVVLAKSGSYGLRKGLAGLGGGFGLGSAWTRTSINLEEALGDTKSRK